MVGGILTIPIVIGLFCAPAGCLVMFIGLLMSNPVPQHQVMYVTQPANQQPVQQYQQPPQK
ncbi:MAG: hypothetical protein ACKVHH_02435 [Candidatus Poseidoniales archaeon]